MFTKEFEDYLKSQYSEPSSRQVFVDVANFFQQYPHPESIDEHLDLRRIKFLTKIASHAVDAQWEIRNGTTFPSDAVETAIKYCLAGITRAESGRIECICEQLADVDVVKMHAHLYSHMGKFEQVLARRTPNINAKKALLLSARNHVGECIRIGEPVETEHPAYQFLFKAHITADLSELCDGDEQRTYFIESAQEFAEGARRSEKFDPVHSAHQYTFASDQFYKAAIVTPEGNVRIEFLASAVETGKKGAEMVREQNPTHWAVTCGNIGKFAEALYDETKDVDWKNEAIRHYALLGDYMASLGNNRHIVHAMHMKVKALRAKNDHKKTEERHVETKFIKRADERHKTRTFIRDELKDHGY